MTLLLEGDRRAYVAERSRTTRVRVVDVRFVAQPYEDGVDLRDYLQAVAGDPSLTTLRIVVAWAKRSGLGRAVRQFKLIRERGAQVLAIAGVSEGGATRQGLEALIKETDEAYVFHDQGRTFHPKVYLATGETTAELLVGSHNLTAGGFAWNYEAAIWCKLDLSDAEDRKLHDEVVSYFDRLRADAEVCLPLTPEALAVLLADKSLSIQDEDKRRAPKVERADKPEETDSAGDAVESPAAFGSSNEKKRTLPPLRSKAPIKGPKASPAPVTGGVDATRPSISAVRRYFKKMKSTDAQQPPGLRSKATGNLRLSEEDFGIDSETYFFDEFFGGLDWRPSERKPETMDEVWIPMHVVIDGDYLGEVALRISHQLSRVSGQGNVPTVLHWGDLGARMRQNNYVNQYATLERDDEATFVLTVSQEPPGDFRY